MAQEEIDAVANGIAPINLIAIGHSTMDQADLTSVISQAETAFRIGERTFCGEMDFEIFD